ncbi:MAG: DUF559 domain-containing protein [Proteobacteria bacterium]|jgi:very-short-patch-repair endonuclease|nr:DUF559 domain-containing protein [Pseudomonadota bacterium]
MRKRELLALARQMRSAPTPSEGVFWQVVRNRKLCGTKFRRQQIIGPFIVDFFAPSHRLVVEIDDGIHFGQEESDAERERFLYDCGLRVLRFSADSVDRDLSSMVARVTEALRSISPLRLTERGRG